MTNASRSNPFNFCIGNAKLAGAIALAAASAWGVPAHAQEFDCRAAALASERAICNSGRLSVLDERMSFLYNRLWQVLRKDGAREGLREYQLMFLRTRDRCGRDEECLAGAYLDQIEVLKERLAAKD